MNKTYQTNTRVSWTWGDGTAGGNIRDVCRDQVTRTLQGAEVTRDGSDDDPAYLIEQDDGDRVLKLHSEIEKST